MDYSITKIVGLFTTSGSLIVIVLLIGVASLWSDRWWKRGRALLSLFLLAALLLVITPLQPWLTGMLEDRFPARPALPEHVDGIIILGGMLRPNISKARGMPSLNDAAERLIEGARLALEHPEAKVLFTGGSADPWNPESRESTFAGAALERMGISADRILLEDLSRNTHENAVLSADLPGVDRKAAWVLVTSAMHMPRAVAVFRQEGWNFVPWPTNYVTGGDVEWTNEDVPIVRLYNLSHTLHEWVGLAYYRLRGWTGSLFPLPN